MSCKLIQRRLSAWLDHELSANEAEVLRTHLDRCPGCTVVAGQLKRLKRAMGHLSEMEPPHDLFERSLDMLSREPTRGGWFWPMMGGSLAVAATLAGMVFWIGLEPMPSKSMPIKYRSARMLAVNATAGGVLTLSPEVKAFDHAEAHYQEAIESLRRISQRESVRWSPSQRDKYEGDLRLFDAALKRSRVALELSPIDPQTRELHFAAYQQEIRYLQQAILGTVSDKPSRIGLFEPKGAVPVVWQP